MATWSADAYARRLDALARELDRDVRRGIERKAAEHAQRLAKRAASADLGGDPKFSGWRPALDTQVLVKPRATLLTPTKRSAGPWTVAELGRHTDGGVGLFQGPGANLRTGRTSRSRKTGEVVVRQRRQRATRRWNGRTLGKGTASDALRDFDRLIPKFMESEIRKAIRTMFGG